MRIVRAPRRLLLVLALAVAAATGVGLEAGLPRSTAKPVAATPRTQIATAVPDGFRVEAGLRYLPGTDPYGLLDAYLPPTGDAQPWVFVLHGGAWAAGNRTDPNSRRAIDTFTSAGYAVFSADYPLITDQAGYVGVSWTVERDAVAQAVRYVRANAASFGIDPSRGVIYGFSAGGNLSASIALRDPTWFRGFVSVSGVLEPQHVMTETLKEWTAVAMRCPYLPTWHYCAARWQDAEPLTHVAAGDPPALFFAGDDDPLVPAAGAVHLAAALRVAGTAARVVIAHGTRHEDGSWYGNPTNTAILLDFVATCVGRTS
jgi:acetyl esterase/lipase